MENLANRTNSTQEELIYSEKYHNFENLLQRIQGPALVACGALGLLSSILILVTICWNDLFKEPCFICYRAIAIFGFCFSFNIGLHFAFMSLIWWRVHSNIVHLYSIQWIIELNTYVLMDTSRESIGLIMVFLSCERAIAVFLPTKFYLVDRRSVCYIVVALAVLPQLAVNLPHLFLSQVTWHDDFKGYNIDTSPMFDNVFGKIKSYIWMGLSIAVSNSLK